MKPILNKIMLVCIFFVLCFSFVSNVKSFSLIEETGVCVNTNELETTSRRSCIDSSGVIHTVYLYDDSFGDANNSLMYEHSNDGGITWTCYRKIPSPAETWDITAEDYDIVCDSNDKLWVAYYWRTDSVDANYVRIVNSTNGGVTWGTDVSLNASFDIGADGAQNQNLDMVVDDDDDITLVLAHAIISGYQITVHHLGDSGTWSTLYVNDPGSFELRNVGCDVLSNDTVVVGYLYDDNTPNYNFLRYFYYYPSTNTNSVIYDLYNDTSNSTGCFSMVADGYDVVHFAYSRINNSKYGIYYKNLTSGSLSGEVTVAYNSTYNLNHPSISWTANNDLDILFDGIPSVCGFSNEKILYSYKADTGSWSNVSYMNIGNDNKTWYPRIIYNRYPNNALLMDGFRFVFYNASTYNFSYADCSQYYWCDLNCTAPECLNYNLTPISGNITINVYNESNPAEGLPFNVFVTNESGSETYYETGCTNPTILSYGDIPTGNKISFLISSDGYCSRQFYIDIDTSINYVVNVYLAPVNESHLYFINVINEYSEPVEDVLLVIKRYINDTGRYENMTSLYTDGIGQCSAYLLPGVQYKIYLNKTGYKDKTDDWIPDPTYFGIYYPKYFTIYHLDYNISPDYDPWDYIVFEGWMYTNGTIKINYEDLLEDTINATFYTYEINGSNLSSTLVSTNNTTNDIFTFWVYGINASRMHCIYLYLNHSILDYQILHICLSPVNITDNINETDIENKITDVFGDFSLGYVNFFFVFLPAIFLLVIPGYFHPGIGILSAGLWLGFGSIYFGLPSIITLLAPFLMMIGTILMIVKGGASKL